MSDVNYFEIIKNKLDALVDRIIQRESSDENFRMTYAQILEKINTKMDVFSSSDEVQQIELLRSEMKDLFNEKDENLNKKFKGILQEFQELDEELKNSAKTPELIQAFQSLQKNIKYFSEEIENQRNALNSTLSYLEKCGTLENTNRYLESEFSIVKGQNAIINDNLISQLKLLNDHSSEYDAKFIELIGTINTDLNCLIEQNKGMPQKSDTNLMYNKLEDLKLEFEKTKEFIGGVSNNVTTLIEVVDNIFQNEEFEKIQNDALAILSHTTLLTEAIKTLGTRDDISQTLSAANVEMKEYNTDLITKLEERLLEKLDLSSLENIKDYTEKMFYQGTEVLKEEIWSIKDTLEEVKENIGAVNESVSEINASIGTKLDSLRDEIADNLAKESISKAYQFENITDTVIAKQAEKIDEAKEELTDIISEESIAASNSLNSFKKQFAQQLIQVAENISFIEEAEDIHNHIYDVSDELKEKITSDISEIAKILNKIDEKVQEPDNEQKEAFDNLLKELKTLTTGSANSSDDYFYTMPDVESDLSKIRLDLSNISKTLVSTEASTEENISDIHSSINNLRTSLQKLEENTVNEEIEEVKSLFGSLNDDISSISKRTNKLIISSDEVNKTLQNHINEFTGVVQNFDTITKTFSEDAFVVNLNRKIDNLTNLSNSLVSSDKVLNEAFMYLAEWIDTTSVSFNEIKENITEINENVSTMDEVSHKIEMLTKKVEKQDDNLQLINQKLNAILEERSGDSETKTLLEFIASQVSAYNEKMSENDKLNQRLETMEKQLKKIEKNVVFLASYVDDED